MMGALRNVLSKFQRALKLDRYGRDENSAPEVFRRTQVRPGLTVPIPFEWLPDLARITKGNHSLLMLLILIRQSCLSRMKRGQKLSEMPEWTIDGELKWWAGMCGCSERQLYDNIEYGAARQIFEMRRAAKDRVAFRVLGNWRALADYEPLDEPEEPEVDEPEEPAQPAAARVPLLKSGVSLKPSGEKLVKVARFVQGIRFRSVDKVNFVAIDGAAIQDGIIDVTLFAAENRKARSSETNDLAKFGGSGLPNQGTTPGGGGTGIVADGAPKRKLSERDRRLFEYIERGY